MQGRAASSAVYALLRHSDSTKLPMSMMMQAEWFKEARAVDSQGPVREEDLAKRLVKKVLTVYCGDGCCSSDATAHTHRQDCWLHAYSFDKRKRKCIMRQRCLSVL